MSQEKIDHLKPMVSDIAEERGLATELVFAVIIAENAGLDPTATRFEPAFWRRYVEGKEEWKAHPLYLFPEVLASSYGLMQVMYTTAVWINGKHGDTIWSGDWQDLFDVKVNITLGTDVLAYKITRYGVRNGVAAYNGGSPRLNPVGELVPELARYVRQVEEILGIPLVDDSEGEVA